MDGQTIPRKLKYPFQTRSASLNWLWKIIFQDYHMHCLPALTIDEWTKVFPQSNISITRTHQTWILHTQRVRGSYILHLGTTSSHLFITRQQEFLCRKSAVFAYNAFSVLRKRHTKSSWAKTTGTFSPAFSRKITPKILIFSKYCTWSYFKIYL